MKTKEELIEEYQDLINTYDASKSELMGLENEDANEKYSVAANIVRGKCAEDTDWDSVLAFLCIQNDFFSAMIKLGFASDGREGALQGAAESIAVMAQMTLIINTERMFR